TVGAKAEWPYPAAARPVTADVRAAAQKPGARPADSSVCEITAPPTTPTQCGASSVRRAWSHLWSRLCGYTGVDHRPPAAADHAKRRLWPRRDGDPCSWKAEGRQFDPAPDHQFRTSF